MSFGPSFGRSQGDRKVLCVRELHECTARLLGHTKDWIGKASKLLQK